MFQQYTDLIDKDRKEVHTDNEPGNRELMVQIWYPATISDKPTHWYINPQSSETIKKDLQSYFQVQCNQLSFLDTVQTHAVHKAKVSKFVYPVIVFSPGFGSPVNFYTSLLEELASHGYIVVSISYPYVTSAMTFPDRKILHSVTLKALQELWKLSNEDETAAREEKIWIDDISFVMRQLEKINLGDPHDILTGTMDLDTIGMFGHSFGGGASVSACRILNKCKAVATLDGRPHGPDAQKGFDTPALFVRSSLHRKEKAELFDQLWQSVTEPSYYAVIKDALHGSFTDLFLFIEWKGNPSLKLDPMRGIEMTRALLVNFFDKYLKSKAIDLDKINDRYPEISMRVKH